MGKFRYGIAVSAFFDNELDDETKVVPAAIFGGAEARKRLEGYSRIRAGLLEMISRAPDVPEETERSLMLRIREKRYKLLPSDNGGVSFMLVTIGRMIRQHIRTRTR